MARTLKCDLTISSSESCWFEKKQSGSVLADRTWRRMIPNDSNDASHGEIMRFFPWQRSGSEPTAGYIMDVPVGTATHNKTPL